MTSEFADVAQRLRGKPLRGPQYFPFRIKPFLFLFLFLEHLHTSMRAFFFFPHFSSGSAQHGNSFCYVNALNASDWLHCLEQPSPVCSIPGCVLDNGMDGSQITLGRAAGEQKKADRPRALQGEVVCGCACS